MELQEAFDAGFAAVKSYVENSFKTFEQRIAALEVRTAERGEKGEAGPAGKDADPAIIARLVEEAVARLPPAERGDPGAPGVAGRDGVDGKDSDPEVLERMVTEKIAAIPVPLNGEPGRDGKDVDPAFVEAVIVEKVAAAVSSIPVPKNGLDGKDGVGLAGAMIDRDGALALTMSDGSIKNLGQVVGRDGDHGKCGLDGKDGLGFDDLSIEYDGERTFTWSFVRGDQQKTFPVVVPLVLDRGVWREGQYAKGDAVTLGGSLWIAQEETTDKPELSKAWRLAAKRGRDGKDGKNGERGSAGPEGRPGRDLTQLGFDGGKH